MLERILKEAEKPMLKSEILKLLPNLDFRTLNSMLDQLEAEGRIVVGGKGVLWTHNDSRQFNDLLEGAVIHDV